MIRALVRMPPIVLNVKGESDEEGGEMKKSRQ